MAKHSTAADTLRTLYGTGGELTPLDGELDENFLVRSDDGGRSILKIMHEGCPEARVALQCALLEHLVQNASGFRHPVVITTVQGEQYRRADIEGAERIVWRLSYCEGTLLADHRPRTHSLQTSLGTLLGRLTEALSTLAWPGGQGGNFDVLWHLPQAAAEARTALDSIDEPTREAVRTVLDRFEDRVAPAFGALPHSVVHNDANDHNLLVGALDDPAGHDTAIVDGIFDFGDLGRQPTVCEVAVGMAYAILDEEDPLGAAGRVLAGFHAVHPLSEAEIDVAFDLMSIRLAVSVAIGSRRARQQPDQPYLAISLEPAKRALARLAAIRPALATAVLRHACGLEAVPGATRVTAHLASGNTVIRRAVAIDGDVCVLDLSGASLMLGADPRAAELDPLTTAIELEMKRAGTAYAIGRWAESRAIYNAPAFTGGRHPTADSRTHHLGLDVFCPAGTPIRAPLDGVVEVATINDAPLDYGGLVVLRHEVPGGPTFHTLYGHLSAKSVGALVVGDRVAAGDELARLGTERENGGWTPHLHIQVALDLFGLGRDFPGVALEREAAFWQTVSPNPERLLGFCGRSDFEGRVDLRPLIERRARLLGPSLSLTYAEPLHIVRGFGQFLYDSHGHAYLDIYNNVPHVGHSHRRVVEAVQRQIALLNTNTRYLHEAVLDYAERLTSTMPDPLSVCYFVTSGSEANELAVRLARAYTGRRDLLVAEGAYHGHTTSLIDLSPYKHDGPGGDGPPPWVHTVPNPDDFRGPWKRDDPSAGRRYADLVREAVERAEEAGGSVAAFLSETYPSVAGQIVPPPGYVAAAYAHVRAAGAIAIADEIQTGFGRLGAAFWGFAAQGAVPDIVVLGKPIANGFPMGAVVTTPEIASAFDNGMEFFSTFGGNPVAAAAALAVLDVVEGEGLQEHAARLGTRFLNGLGELATEFPLVGDVRGQGFFLGLELVRDPETLEPADWEARYLVDRLRDHRILAGTDGIHHNVVKIRPSMIVEAGDIDLVLERLRSILAETPLAAT